VTNGDELVEGEDGGRDETFCVGEEPPPPLEEEPDEREDETGVCTDWFGLGVTKGLGDGVAGCAFGAGVAGV